MRRGTALVGVLALALAQSSAASPVDPFPFEGVVGVEGPASLIGTGDLALEGPAMFSDPRVQDVRLAMSVVDGRLLVRNHPRQTAGTTSDGPIDEQQANLGPLDPEVWQDRPFTGRVELQEILQPMWYRVLPTDGDRLRVHAGDGSGLEFGAPMDLTGQVPEDAVIEDEYTVGHSYPTAGLGTPVSSREGLRLQPQGEVVVALYGAVLHFTGESDSFTVRSEPAINHTRSVAPGPGIAGYFVEDRPVAYLFGVQTLDVSGEGFRFFAQQAEGTWTGDVGLGLATVQATFNGTSVTESLAFFQTIGDFRVTSDLAAKPAMWTLDGNATFVALDTQTVAGDREAHLALTVALGAAGLAALLAVLAKWGRALLALVPGLNVAEPLGNRQRVLVLAAVAKNPGVDQSELTGSLALARGTVRHHLRILMRADLITERPMGARLTYTLNDSSYEFRASPAASTSAAQAFALLRHPQRRALFESLRAGGPADFERLQERLGGGLARDACSYHLGLLLRAGLVERGRDGRRVLWSAKVDPAALGSVQRERFLALGHLNQVLAAVPPEGRPLEDILRQARASGWRGTRRQLAAKVDLLAAVGYVQRSDAGYSLAP